MPEVFSTTPIERGSVNGDNAKLRRAYELEKPIILLRKVRDGVSCRMLRSTWSPIWSTSVSFCWRWTRASAFLDWGPPTHRSAGTRSGSSSNACIRRSFVVGLVSAYATQCAICRLRHGELLDAAHITADRDEGGLPEVARMDCHCARSITQRLTGISLVSLPITRSSWTIGSWRKSTVPCCVTVCRRCTA